MINFYYTFTAMHSSKCKYMKGVVEHASKHIVNIRRLCRTLPGQSDLFVANTKRCAIPIEGAGGLIAIVEVSFYIQHKIQKKTEPLKKAQNNKIAKCCWFGLID